MFFLTFDSGILPILVEEASLSGSLKHPLDGEHVSSLLLCCIQYIFRFIVVGLVDLLVLLLRHLLKTMWPIEVVHVYLLYIVVFSNPIEVEVDFFLLFSL